MDFTALMIKIGTLLLSIVCGYLAAKAGYIKEEHNTALSNVAINIATPMLMLSSVMGEEHLLSNMEVIILTIFAVGSYGIPVVTGKFLMNRLHIPTEQRGLYRYMYVFSSIGFIGYPLVSAMFGKSAMFYVTVFSLIFSIVCWTYGVQIFQNGGEYRFSWSFLKSPCVISAVAAYIIYFSGIKVPAVIADTASFLGEIASPLIMIVTGCALAGVSLKEIFCQKEIYILCLVKMVLIPLFTYFILQFFVQNELLLAITTIMISMPMATNTTAIAYQYGQDGRSASRAVILSTLLSIITIPLIMLILFR